MQRDQRVPRGTFGVPPRTPIDTHTGPLLAQHRRYVFEDRWRPYRDGHPPAVAARGRTGRLCRSGSLMVCHLPLTVRPSYVGAGPTRRP